MIQPRPSILSNLNDFQAWSKTSPTAGPISLLDYVGFVATPDLLFGFASLFWPDIVVHDEMRFLASRFSVEAYAEWVASGRSPREIQRVMNHVHISTLLQQQAVSDEVALEAARLIVEMWSRTLGPEGLVAEAVGRGLDDAAVTFFEGP